MGGRTIPVRGANALLPEMYMIAVVVATVVYMRPDSITMRRALLYELLDSEDVVLLWFR